MLPSRTQTSVPPTAEARRDRYVVRPLSMPDLALAPNSKTPPPDAQVKGGAMRLGEILVARGLVRVSDVETAVRRQHELGGWLGDNLIALGYLTPDQLATVINATPPLPNTLAET